MLYDGGGVRLVVPQHLRLVPCGDSHANHIGTFWFADIRTPSWGSEKATDF
jgi:hypothetical protein